MLEHDNIESKRKLFNNKNLPNLLAASLIIFNSASASADSGFQPNPIERSALSILIDQTDIPLTLSQWPLQRSVVRGALLQLPKSLSPAATYSKEVIERALVRQESASIGINATSRSEHAVGNGDAAISGPALGFQSKEWQTDAGSLRLGVSMRGASVIGPVPANTVSTQPIQLDFEGTSASTTLDGVVLQAWSRRSWWGPGWQSSLVLGNNAPALVGMGVQRASTLPSESPWLSWLGPWNGEIFLAQTTGHASPSGPLLFGNRLTFRPFSGTEVGLTRVAQWGGQGRDRSLNSFGRMLTGLGTNADTTAQQAVDPGNQMAGLDLRQRCPAGWPCAAYGQWIGEDMAGLFPSKYLSLYGLELRSPEGRHLWFVEHVRTSCSSEPGSKRVEACAYRNGQYPEGYASERRWLGSSFGPDARVTTLGWLDAESTWSVRYHAGRLGGLSMADARSQPGAVFAYAAGESARLKSVQAQRDWAVLGGTLTPSLGWQSLASETQTVSTWSGGMRWVKTLD